MGCYGWPSRLQTLFLMHKVGFFFTKWVRKHANRQHYILLCHFPLLLWQNVPISYSFLIFLSFDSHIHKSCSNNDFAMLNMRKMILRVNDNTRIRKHEISTWRTADIINQSRKGKMKNSTTYFLNNDITNNSVSDVSKFPLSNSSSTPPPSTKGSRYSPWQKRKKAPLLHHRVMQKRNYQHELRRSIITYSLWSFKFNIGIFLWGEKEF